ncbi:NRDE family protein [Microbacterium lushaniae]|uniref:NRDE family protein n=1 Tax=Microbacterium lushaniae TaxID=2614639 RepID=A0A5J6L0M0_9MICO|nr:NRDE family protein [Microbacterium lushaniae]QEW02038.1 NRDE family protein [Microbacterium lushaniae]
MCTVIVHVPQHPAEPAHVLAIRDEDPARAWDPPGPWWPQTHPGVIGVRDARAGGAWLAADAARSRLAVILNRREVPGATQSRGAIVLDAVDGRRPAQPRTNGFNLVVVDRDGARVTGWDGTSVRERVLEPGVHMIAHDDVDDPATPRIARWLPEFAAAPPVAASAPWWREWMLLLERSAELPPTDDRAIVRDNRPYGVETLSLLVCAASVGPEGVDLAYGELAEPGQWNRVRLVEPAL